MADWTDPSLQQGSYKLLIFALLVLSPGLASSTNAITTVEFGLRPLRLLFALAPPYSHNLVMRNIAEEVAKNGHTVQVSTD